MSDNLCHTMNSEYAGYLRDESRMTGEAAALAFPGSEKDAAEILKQVESSAIPVTIQGARTGVTGGAVPKGGCILNLERMNKIYGLHNDEERKCAFVTLQPGVQLSELHRVLSGSGWFFPPDPTETSASIGGMAACNASGARSYKYGAVRDYTDSLHVVLPGGGLLELKRGRHKAAGRSFSITAGDGRLLEGELPSYVMPQVKNASGYFAKDDMDLVDLFVGSEGTLGVITEIKLRLLKQPAEIWGIMAFFPGEGQALSFVRQLRLCEGDRPAAIEFFNHSALNLLRHQKRSNAAFSGIPDMPPEYHTAIYSEFHGCSSDEVEDVVVRASGLLAECGGSDESTWIASAPHELERMYFFRHAVPEAVNLTIDERRKSEPGLTKLGTDMAVPDEMLENAMDMYNRTLAEAGLESVIFGHIGCNHVHVNILPSCIPEYESGRMLYREWAGKVVRMGGTVSAEHGIGKIKTALLGEMYGIEGVEQMKGVKRVFDPKWLLNRGNLFDAE